jgi:prolyl 4-hydroxylase
VVSYRPGGRYLPHYDACKQADDDDDTCARMNESLGPRRLTVLLYLNEDFAGGETVFPKLGVKVRPLTGLAILFSDTDAHGNTLEASLHGGEQVTRGEKWVCNKWVH